MSVISTISIIVVIGLLFVAVVYFSMKNGEVSMNSIYSIDSTTSKEFSDDMSEKYKSVFSESSESSEETIPQFPQFTTEQQFENVQSNIFNPEVQETEIRVWDDGYATQGLGIVGYK